VPIVEIAFAVGSDKLSGDAKNQLNDIAGMHKERGGKIRVVGYAERGSGKDAAQQELRSFGLALDRAKSVAVALTQLGVPANDISVEAAPADPGASAEPHAEIFMAY
jgi:outer membrane protein OmpA-like peptidoglycan-associated protein